MRISFPSTMIGLTLLAIVTLPQVTAFMFGTNSVGGFAISLICILLITIHFALGSSRKSGNAKAMLFILALLTVVLVNGTYSFMMHSTFDFNRFASSYLLLVFFMLGALAFDLWFRGISNRRAHYAIKFVFYVLLISTSAYFFHFSPFGNLTRRPVFFYTEPSHFGLGFAPFLLYMAYFSGKWMRYVWVLVGFLIGTIVTNLTLVAGTVLVMFLVIPWRRIVMIIPLVLVMIVFGVGNAKHFTSRIDLSPETKAHSALGYLSGMERAYLDLKDTYGTGVGFQQFGIIGERGVFMERLAEINLADMNLYDGSAVAFKLTGELGLIGIAVLLAYLAHFWKHFRRLHATAMSCNLEESKDVFMTSCFLMFILDFFVRGESYYSAVSFMFLSSVVWLMLRKRALADRLVA